VGSWGFRGLDLFVDRRVLIPRPETEQVVEHALRELDGRTAGRHPRQRRVVVDLGTGSGAIALAVAAERPGTEVWATDVSAGALEVAGANLAGLGGRPATTVRLVAGSWWGALPAELRGRVDVAVSNPPYIASGEMETLPPEVAGWEPRQALEAGPSGLEAIHAIIGGARPWVSPGGALVVEIAPHQAEAAAAAAVEAGFVLVEVRPDLTGRPRVLVAG
ncbi:MAG TPA: peptide chain release factor N(5)-glutamine methyltransferase, partial [Acidimicrobiales bacterium]|nr:peptide chain release factor N(5)-glutamine methyltransferase [Acidimicrobiales bacterium]